MAYGRPFIANPDLVYRFTRDLPLAEADPKTFFTHEEEGYTTYPSYKELHPDSAPADKSPALLAPITIEGLEIQSRVVMAPLTRGRSGASRVPNDLNRKYYEQRAEGTGIIITEGTTIDDEHSNGWSGNAGIYTDEHVEGWKKVVDAVHAKGAKIVVQLWHLGRAGHSSFLDGRQVISASPIVIDGKKFGSNGVHTADESTQPYETPRALETEEIAKVVENYRKAAERAVAAGFDGVEVHSANGYLLNTFLDSRSNQRTDKYGGSLENRFRFLDEVLTAVSTVIPANRIGVRLSPNGVYNDMGAPDSIETFTYALQRLAKKGLLYTHVMDGLAFGFHQQTEPFTIEAMRKVYTEAGGKALMANCGYTQEAGEKVVAGGHADLVAYGRPFIANPDLVYRFARGLPLADADPKTFFTHEEEGYTTYPTYKEALEQKKAASTSASE